MRDERFKVFVASVRGLAHGNDHLVDARFIGFTEEQGHGVLKCGRRNGRIHAEHAFAVQVLKAGPGEETVPVGLERGADSEIYDHENSFMVCRGKNGADVLRISQRLQGAEKTLIKRVMGRKVPSGGLPADVGVIVDNISTVKAISDAIQKGMPLIERVTTITGEKIKNPGNFIIKIGTSVKDLIDYCGGFTDDDVLVKMGGPMMGFPLNTLEVPMMKGSNGIIAIEPDETKEQPCIKCGRCVDVCPMELSPLYFVKYAKDENWQGMKDMNVMDCVECRCCQYICSSKIPIINSIKAGKGAVRGMK